MTPSKLTLVPSRSPALPTEPGFQSPLVAAARREVGRMDMADVVDVLREAMVREALERAGGNITHASDLLGISRQAVQQLIRRFELVKWHQNLRSHEGNEGPSFTALVPLAR